MKNLGFAVIALGFDADQLAQEEAQWPKNLIKLQN